MALHPVIVEAFEDELEKIAAMNPAIRNALIGAGAGGGLGALGSRDGERGRGALLGAGAGGALGAGSHYAYKHGKKFLDKRKAVKAYNKKGRIGRFFSRNPSKKK